MSKIGRNAPCSCGSGRKFKRCCGAATTVVDLRSLERELSDENFQVEVLLLDAGAEPVGTSNGLRTFEVSAVLPGHGVWVEEIDADGERGAPIWIEEEVGSWASAVGDFFALPLAPNDTPRLMPVWEDCPHCQKLIRERRRTARAL